MPINVVSGEIVALLGIFLLSASISPAFHFMNYFFRDEPVDVDRERSISIVVLAATLFAGLIVVNGVASTDYMLLSVPALIAFLAVFILAIGVTVVMGLLLSYPLHRLKKWREPPDIITEYEP